MYAIRLILPPFVHRGNVAKRILARFSAEAGPLIEDAIKGLLGTDAVYQLQPAYAQQKPKLKQYRATPGKPAHQPLILTGSLYDGLGFHLEGNVVVIQVADGAGLAKNGDDYAEMWEQKTHFLEAGFALVETKVGDLLTQICLDEMSWMP